MVLSSLRVLRMLELIVFKQKIKNTHKIANVWGYCMKRNRLRFINMKAFLM